MKFRKKRGQVGETVTWVVATLVIIVMLVFSIFVVSLVRGNKRFNTGRKDLLVSKSFVGYLLTEDNSGESVFEQLMNKDDSYDVLGIFNDFNGELAKRIFLNFYGDKYRIDKMWIGVYHEKGGILYEKRNIYFGVPPVQLRGGDQNWRESYVPYTLEEIELDDESLFYLIFTN